MRDAAVIGDDPAVAATWDLLGQIRGRTSEAHGFRSSAVGATLPPITVFVGGAWESAGAVPEAAATLLDLYLPICLNTAGGFAMAQMGQSVDGRTATENGSSHYITGRADRVHLHRLRALCDAVVIGAGTAIADDPRLTVRHVHGDNPVRVLLDPNGRVPTDGALFRDGDAPNLLLRRRGVTRSCAAGKGEVLELPDCDPAETPRLVLDLLRERGLRRVLIEGGGTTVSHFLAAGCLDRLHVTVAPLLIGSGRPSFTLPPIMHLDQALRPPCRHFALGDDVLFDFDLTASSTTAPGRLESSTSSP